MKEELIAPCGMNCGICVSYLFMKNDCNKHGFSKKTCEGCLPRGENCTFMQNHCELLCDGLVRFCYECENYPCKRLKALDKRYRTKYHMSMLDNLACIKEQGMDTFLLKEKKKWQCPHCGDVRCCHNGLCLHCEIDRLVRNKRYCWSDE